MSEIQQKLKAPKGQTNKFGNYKYRSCEDIVEALKPILAEHNLWLIISDDIHLGGDRYYVKATATIFSQNDDGGKTVVGEATAYAREPLVKKGMDEAQITGATSSYARKYALNGLLAIDDTKDSDSQDNREQMSPEPINMEHVNSAIKAFKEEIDKDDLDLGHERIQQGWGRLTNDERIAVQEGMKDKPEGSRKLYKNILIEYINYKPGVDNE